MVKVPEAREALKYGRSAAREALAAFSRAHDFEEPGNPMFFETFEGHYKWVDERLNHEYNDIPGPIVQMARTRAKYRTVGLP